MDKVPNKVKQPSKSKDEVIISIFFNIMNAWQLSEKEQIMLLGSPELDLFYHWKKGEAVVLSETILTRISHVLGIYKNLHILFSVSSQADAWLTKTNSAFNEQSALKIMLKSDIKNLAKVHDYLDAQL